MILDSVRNVLFRVGGSLWTRSRSTVHRDHFLEQRRVNQHIRPWRKRNFQVQRPRVHVRYEDQHSRPGLHPTLPGSSDRIEFHRLHPDDDLQPAVLGQGNIAGSK